MAVEDLLVDGVDALLLAGFAGCLDPSIGAGEAVVAGAALRDEGTSYHYLDRADEYVRPTPALTGAVAAGLHERDLDVRRGTT
jgi:uridine phosphorylase